ncbi:tetratricopeptide repeat protein [Yeosuana marina]|uniref:tetratricopeptide repeat protein n=1 Tax=Yeosuana marina TaxID=1565536 RepID=UPI0030EC4ED6|tara:strand:+ start:930 stop:1541 length:612 start_codon:yes stop_codon:yes gene_type:complete
MKYIILLTSIIFVVIQGQAQDVKKIQTAFENSYMFENDNNIENSIRVLKDVYLDDSYEINLRLGWLYYQKGDFYESQKYYTKAITILPYSEEAKFGLILPKAATAKWDDVIDIYKQILIISPNNTTANYRLGLIFYNKKMFSDAYVLFEKVVNLYPFDFDGLLMYAWSSLQIGKSKEARILFNKVLMNTPNNASALEGLALLK